MRIDCSVRITPGRCFFCPQALKWCEHFSVSHCTTCFEAFSHRHFFLLSTRWICTIVVWEGHNCMRVWKPLQLFLPSKSAMSVPLSFGRGPTPTALLTGAHARPRRYLTLITLVVRCPFGMLIRCVPSPFLRDCDELLATLAKDLCRPCSSRWLAFSRAKSWKFSEGHLRLPRGLHPRSAHNLGTMRL